MIVLAIASPIILIIGLLGNLISFIVFTNEKMRNLPTFRFLAYLSLIDFLYVLTGIPHLMSISFYQFDFRNSSNFICSFHSFLTIFLSHLSSNLLAAIGVFRCFELTSNNDLAKKRVFLNKNNFRNKQEKDVAYSSDRKSIFKRFISYFGKVEFIILIIITILLICDSHFLIMMRISEHFINNENVTNISNKISICHPANDTEQIYFEFYTIYWPWIDLLLYSYIPFIIMVTSTTIIIQKLVSANRNFIIKKKNNLKPKFEIIELTDMNESVQMNNELEPKDKKKEKKRLSKQFKKRKKRNNQVYKLLIFLNTTFFLLVTPVVLCNSLKILKFENEFVLEFVYILAYLNHCINFICYTYSCEMFRKILFNKSN
jgi:hypothetical protein